MTAPTTGTASAGLDALFASTRAQDRAALVAYLPVGFPSYDVSVAAITACVEAGVDAVEVGIPYTDPGMDGPVIQVAVDAALRAGTRTRDVLRAVETVSATGAPTLVMGYWNPIERYGPARFAADLAAAGGAGAITPDLIPEEAAPWTQAARDHGLATVFLVAPSSTEERIAVVAEVSRGFVYAAAVMGVTGARSTVSDRAERLVARTRAHTSLPVCVGLGVSDGDQAAAVGRYADGVIVGSALVKALTEGGVPAVRALAADLANGVRRGR